MFQEWIGQAVAGRGPCRHDKWCCMMLPRLNSRELLSDDGAIFVSIDDNEVHHLRCLMDEVFGEENFIAQIVWEKVYSPKSSAKFFSENHDFIIVYARNRERFNLGMLPRTEEADARYTNLDNDSRGPWKPGDLSARNPYSTGTYKIICPGGRVIAGPPPGNYWRVNKEKFQELCEDNRIWWGEDQNQVPAIKRFLSEVRQGLVPETIWTYREVGHTQDAKRMLLQLFEHDFPEFTTSKPVELISRILTLSTAKDDIVLDSFAGSGTTAHAVLAKNKEDGGTRRFVLCQMPYETKDQEVKRKNICESITAERVKRVIKGVPNAKDETLRVGLGGTFSYFKLGKELRKQAILDGKDLPSYEALAGYVFFTAKGEEFQPRKIKAPYIGTSGERDVFLIYEQDIEKLKDMALNLELARSIAKRGSRKKLVFAPTKYLDQDYISRLGIEFCQLPFEIYQKAQGR